MLRTCLQPWYLHFLPLREVFIFLNMAIRLYKELMICYDLCRNVMRPLLRSYGDNRTVTLSPGKILIKNLLILPAGYAVMVCPLAMPTVN